MKTKLFRRISGVTLVGVLTLAGGTVLGFGPAAQEEGRGNLEGTWLNEVKIVTCPPAPFAVIATLQSMHTIMRGGILLEAAAHPLRRRPSRGAPVTAYGSARGVTPFSCSSVPTVSTIWVVASESAR